MKPTIEQIDAAINSFNYDLLNDGDAETILFALRFTKKIMGEPSEAMIDAGENTFVSGYTGTPSSTPDAVLEAMVNQAIKEIEDE